MKRLIEVCLILVIVIELVAAATLLFGPDQVPVLHSLIPKTTVTQFPTNTHPTDTPTKQVAVALTLPSITPLPTLIPTARPEPTSVTPRFPFVFSGSGSAESAYYELPTGAYGFRWSYQGAPGKGEVPKTDTNLHQIQLDAINYQFQILIDMYNEFISEAVGNRDALALDEWQSKRTAAIQERDQLLAQENARYQ